MAPGKSPNQAYMKITALILGISLAGLVISAPAGQGTNPPASAGEQSRAQTHVRKVGVDEFEKLWRDKHNVVLDVRTKKEYEAGHIPGAVNLDVNSTDFRQKVSKLDKDKVYLVHCAAGVRSARACAALEQLGFKDLADLTSGFKGWEKAGKPVEK